MSRVMGLDPHRVTVMRSILDLATRGLDRRTPIGRIREGLVVGMEICMRDLDEGTAILTDSGLWFPPDLTDDERVALALDLHPRLRRRFPAAVGRNLRLRD